MNYRILNFVKKLLFIYQNYIFTFQIYRMNYRILNFVKKLLFIKSVYTSPYQKIKQSYIQT